MQSRSAAAVPSAGTGPWLFFYCIMFGRTIQPGGEFFTLSTGFSTVFTGRGRNFPPLFHSFNGLFNNFDFQPFIPQVMPARLFSPIGPIISPCFAENL